MKESDMKQNFCRGKLGAKVLAGRRGLRYGLGAGQWTMAPGVETHVAQFSLMQ